MKRDPWVLYCEAFRESFPGAGVKIELSPVALDAFYRKVMSAECVSREAASGRDAEFMAWARRHAPTQLAELITRREQMRSQTGKDHSQPQGETE